MSQLCSASFGPYPDRTMWNDVYVRRPAAVPAMLSKLVESAGARRGAIIGAHLVALVRTGATSKSGVPAERRAAT
ncbi:hypothetical protein OHT57_44210 [Streptomyces sp. NBC_00285]|uniref:hypothetical protein n=1 Tax=Streptomyces sp. NBC_00285 TaxID=2975700 RepID=UPI002E2D06BD|nr:hypothetical protein [Streptomyces sp. NBC_00285]